MYVGHADSLSSLPLHASVMIPAVSNITCDNEQLSAVMVQGSVTVPHGDWCDLIGTSIAGSLNISGTGVRIAGSTIGGSVEIDHVVAAADPLSSGTNVICNTTVDGNLVLRGSSRSAPWNLGLCGGNTIKGGLVFSGNAASGNVLAGNSIGGSLVCTDGSVAGQRQPCAGPHSGTVR